MNLYEALTTAGHNVSLWRDDPTLLQDYADAIGFVASDQYEAAYYYAAPEQVDYSTMTGQHDTFQVLSIPGNLTSKIEVFTSDGWVAVYKDGHLVQSDTYGSSRSSNEAAYAAAFRTAIDLHLAEVADL